MVTELQCNYTQRPDLNSQIMRSLNLSDLQRMALYVRALFFLYPRCRLLILIVCRFQNNFDNILFKYSMKASIGLPPSVGNQKIAGSNRMRR